MASGSNSLTTYYAKRIIGDSAASAASSALLQTGADITNDIWIISQTERLTSKYGIKYRYDANAHDSIEFYGNQQDENNQDISSAWVQLDTGDAYFMGSVGIGTDTLTYKLNVEGGQTCLNYITAASIANQSSQLLISNSNGGAVGLEFWRNQSGSWQIINTSAILKFRTNWYTPQDGENGRQSVYGLQSLALYSTSGAGSIPYLAIGQSTPEAVTDYRLYVTDGKIKFDIGTTDGSNSNRFIVYGNSRQLSIGAAGIQAYNSSNTASPLYLNWYGSSIEMLKNDDAATSYVYIRSSQDATNTNTGALRVDGGVGVDKDIYVGEQIVFTNKTAIKHIEFTRTTTDSGPSYICYPASGQLGIGTGASYAACLAIFDTAQNAAIRPGADVTYDLGSDTYRWNDIYGHHLVLAGSTNSTMTDASTNPRISFQAATDTQPVHLIYTHVDTYRGPAGLKVIGGTDATPAWFEVEGNLYIDVATARATAETSAKDRVIYWTDTNRTTLAFTRFYKYTSGETDTVVQNAHMIQLYVYGNDGTGTSFALIRPSSSAANTNAYITWSGQRVRGNIYPYVNNTYDLGASSLRWQTGWYETSLIVGPYSSTAASSYNGNTSVGVAGSTLMPGHLEMTGNSNAYIDFKSANANRNTWTDFNARILNEVPGCITIYGNSSTTDGTTTYATANNKTYRSHTFNMSLYVTNGCIFTNWENLSANGFTHLATTNSAGTGMMSSNQGFRILVDDTQYVKLYASAPGTTSQAGVGRLTLGNNLASTTEKNAKGYILMYGETVDKYITINPTDLTANLTLGATKDTFTMFKLNITSTRDSGGTTDLSGDTRPALVIGDITDKHLEICKDEIMAKATANTVSSLYLNYDGGNIQMLDTSTSYYVNIRSTQDASSTATGALRIGGGIGVAKKIYAGSSITTAYSGSHIYLKNTQWTKGTTPSSQTYSAIEYISNDASNNRITLLETTLDTSGNSYFNIYLVPNVAGSTSWSGIVLKKTNTNVLTISAAGGFGMSQTDGTGYGISLYNGGQPAGSVTYGLFFAKTSTFGTLGNLSGDWATYFTMNRSDTRGWIFKSNGGAANTNNNVLAISGNGNISTCGDGIYYVGTKATKRMIRFIDNTADANGNGISIGGGGLAIFGSGESANTLITNLSLETSGGTETTYIASDNSIIFYPGQSSYDASATLTMTASRFWAGVNGDTTREAQVGVQSGAGQLYLYSVASATGNRGLYTPAHGTGAAMSIIAVNTNNVITVNANDVWGAKTRITDNWIGFYSAIRDTTTRYGYIQCTVDRMYFRKENGVTNYHFDFNGHLYTTGNFYAASNSAALVIANQDFTSNTSATNGLSANRESQGVVFYSKNYANWLGNFGQGYTQSNGQMWSRIYLRNYKTDGTNVNNYIYLYANKDGTTSYAVANGAAFRTAISAKGTQTAVSDPSASGTGITYIATISQNTQGVISVTKSTVRSASADQSGVVTTGAQTFAGVKTFNSKITGSISGNCDGSATALKNLGRLTNANITRTTDGGMQFFLASSSMTSNKPVGDGFIIHCHWDGAASNAWDAQLYIPDAHSGHLQFRGHSSATAWGTGWHTILDSENYKTYCTPANIGAAASSHNHAAGDINSGTLGTARGGTGNNSYTASRVLYTNTATKFASGSLVTDGSYFSRAGVSKSWINGRDNAIIKTTSYSGYDAILSMKTTNGAWEIGVYTSDKMYFTYTPDSKYNASDNSGYKQVSIDSAGTITASKFNGNSTGVLDVGDTSKVTTFAYSKAGLGYDDYTWLAGWNGYELRAVNKSQFAKASHGTHVSLANVQTALSPLFTISRADHSGDTGMIVNNTTSGSPLKLGYIVGSSGNGGLYDYTHGAWKVKIATDGTTTFYGSLSGNASSASYASKVGEAASWMYFHHSNEVNFGGTGTQTDIYFGYRGVDSRGKPTQFIFGKSGDYAKITCGAIGAAAISCTTISASGNITVTGSSYVYANRLWANQGTGETRCGVDATTTGNLYLWSNGTNKGLYSGSGYKTGSIITITSTGVTFYGTLSGSATGTSTGVTVAGNAIVKTTDANSYAQLQTTSRVLRLQADGNLVVYQGSTPKWSAGTGSSRLIKQNICIISDSEINKFMKIRPVSFFYRPEMGYENILRYGVIAEELLLVYPNLVDIPDNYSNETFDIKKGMEQPLITVKYDQFIPLLIKMVQNQQKEIEELRRQISKCD